MASKQWALIGVGIVAVGAGFYYYIRVIASMYWDEPNDRTPVTVGPLTRIVTVALTGLVFVLGIWPAPVLDQLSERPAAAVVHK